MTKILCGPTEKNSTPTRGSYARGASGSESQEALMEFPLPHHRYFDNDSVRDLSMLFGRDHELRLIYDVLQKKQSVSLIGSRHIGKSSLLQYAGSPALQQRLGHHLQPYIFISYHANWPASTV